ncbi:DNA internalization-related competence protein ComEC/Rec2 [Sciscionella marina]|uniref:DNA internalization-related competence protein ComEC/Rec2 n=1 Tax=Sciscionella marina TaxID=508770 RepID=UPI00035FDD76|nr:DNA internalization-related competence protein ComEC/Rec2 [Sciscionella marina]
MTAVSVSAGSGGRIDARLVPAALVVWTGAAVGLLFAWWCAVLIGLLGVVFGGWLLVRGRWDRAAALVLLACGLVTAGLLAARAYGVASHPLHAEAGQRSSVRMRVELTNRPKPVYRKGFGDQQSGARTVLIAAKVHTASVAGRAVPGGADVLLFAPVRGWGALLIGQEVTVRGKLAPARGGDTTVAIVWVRGPPGNPGAAGFGQQAAETLRAGLRTASVSLGRDAGGLLPGLVDGDTSGLRHELVSDFKTAGLTHLMAVSGSNLAIVTGAVLMLLRLCRVGPRVAAALAGLALFGFVLLAGPDPSVLRAAVMGSVALAAMALGRQRSALPALSCAIILLVCYDPSMAVDFAFVLSVLATAALVLFVPRWSAGLRGRGVPSGIAQALAVPVAAHLATAPVIAGMSGQVSLVAVLANLLAAPVVAPATVFGVLAALSGPVLPWLATGFVWLAGPEAHWIVLVGTWSARIPGATIGWPPGWIGAVLLGALIVVVLLAMRYRRPRVVVLLGLLAVFTLTVPPRLLRPGWPPTGWAMVSCDVGQGDGAVLATADPHRAVVVDTGPDEEGIDRCLDRLGVRSVPLVLLSHMHADHVGGLRAVLEGRTVGAVALGAAQPRGWEFDAVREQSARAKVPVVTVPTGQRLSWPGLTIDVLGPLPAESHPVGHDGSTINNTSLVLRANTPAGRVLLTGDVETEAQTDLLASGASVRAEVLKIPHHGSRSQAPEFLDATHARIAIASVGADNDYGHPNATTMNRLRADGALLARTDQDGDVAVLPGSGRAAGPRLLRAGAPRSPP